MRRVDADVVAPVPAAFAFDVDRRVDAHDEGLARTQRGLRGDEHELEVVTKAAEAQMVYVMGKEQMKIRPGTNIFRKVVLLTFLWIRENSRTKMADMNIPFDNLVEVGFVKEI